MSTDFINENNYLTASHTFFENIDTKCRNFCPKITAIIIPISIETVDIISNKQISW